MKKEYAQCNDDVLCILGDFNHYSGTVDYINKLATEAKKDCPGLQDNQITVVRYMGRRRKSMAGIEWKWPVAPAGYSGPCEPEPFA